MRRNAQRKGRLLEQFRVDLPSPVQPCTPRLDYEKLRRCVQDLRERERAVVVMTFYHERTGADLAGFLGVSEVNVRVIRHRAIPPVAPVHGDCRMTCSNPIDATVLADYWLASLAKPEEEAFEEHLLECDDCGARLREVIALAEGLRNLAREGSLRMIVSDAFLERTQEDGLRGREYAPPPGGAECTVRAEDNILIGRLAANLSGAKRVDLCICDDRGVEQRRLTDIPAHCGTSSVVYQESITFAKAPPNTRMIARLVAVDDAGGEHLVGEYTFRHTRSLPGLGVPTSTLWR